MNGAKIIEEIGGVAKAMEITGLTKGRISHFVTGRDDIPDHWMRLFKKERPDLDWPYLKGEAPPRKKRTPNPRRRSTDKPAP